MVVFPLILGYIVRIYRGEKPAPEPGQWGTLFVDGLKLLAVQVIYFLPVILLVVLSFIPMISTLLASGSFSENFATMTESQTERWLNSHPELMTAAGTMVLLLLAAVLLAIIITIFSYIGTIRFARTGSISEAFSFSEIVARIRRIGWMNYFIALMIIGVIGLIFGLITNIFSLIPVIGDLIGLMIMIILYVPFILFNARYASLVYDAGEEKPEIPAPAPA